MNEIQSNAEYNRRDFLRGGSIAALATLMGGVRLVAQTAPPEAPAATSLKMKVAVIGLGAWGREILDQLARLPQADVLAICDNYAASLRRAAAKAPNAKATEDYKTILANAEIQAVIVATPTHLHKDIAIAALAAGKHVYCEAPLATTIEDAKAIALAAKKAGKLVFQPGLQLRADPQEAFLLKFVRSGACGDWAAGRAQWNKKTSWRTTSPNPDREKALNWRLDPATSLGLAGEVGLHQMDRASRYFGNLPVAVTGFGAVSLWKDGREVADSAQVVLEYPEGVRLSFEATLANSFEGEANVFFGSYGAVMIRGGSAWMFKEADAPLLGWEVYANKQTILSETGISLRMDASKLKPSGDQPAQQAEQTDPPLFFALQNFLRNSAAISAAIEDFVSTYGDDAAALAEHLEKNVPKQLAPDYLDGYRATVLAIKANEAVIKGGKVAINKDLYELA